ncbi:hypothetical protein [Wenyingzhuangia sp. IMCC45467]
MKKILYCSIIVVLLFSCKTIYNETSEYLKQKGFTYRYSDRNDSKLYEKLNINGYYTINDTLNSGDIFGSYTNLMFFPDGMFVSGFHNCCDTVKEIGKVIPSYFKKIINERNSGLRNYSFYEDTHWGYYELKGDTIKVQHINVHMIGGMTKVWYSSRNWFKIIDKNRIKEIYRYPIKKMTKLDSLNHEKYYKNRVNLVEAYFVPLENIPKSDGWLKYEKWFWENEEDYNIWINQKSNK